MTPGKLQAYSSTHAVSDKDGFLESESSTLPRDIIREALDGIFLLGPIARAVSAEIHGYNVMSFGEICDLGGEYGMIPRPTINEHQ